MDKPLYRLHQLVGLLDHNTSCLDPKHPHYRVDTGKIAKICRVWYYQRNGKTHFEYDITPGYQGALGSRVHEVWLRPLTGQEITGVISTPELLK